MPWIRQWTSVVSFLRQVQDNNHKTQKEGTDETQNNVLFIALIVRSASVRAAKGGAARELPIAEVSDIHFLKTLESRET